MTRLASLDAFRGFTIAAMVLVNNPGDWSNLYSQLAHVHWNGWTFTDWADKLAVRWSKPFTILRRCAHWRSHQ